MSKTYSNTFKRKIAITAKALRDQGESFDWLAKSAQVPPSTIYGWMDKLEKSELNDIDEIDFADIPNTSGTEMLKSIEESMRKISVRQAMIDENMKNILALLQDGKKISNIANLMLGDE